MKTKLAYKIFVAFFFAAAVIVALLIGMQGYVFRSFVGYVNRVELDKLDTLEARLTTMHDRHNGWEPLENNPQGWRDLLEEAGLDMRPPPPPPPEGMGPPERPTRRFPQDEEAGDRSLVQGPHPPPHPHAPPGPFRIGPRLALFDTDKKEIAGPRHPMEQFTLKPIRSGNRIIGWLGLHSIRNFLDPLAEAFLKKQSTFLLVTGTAALVLTALVTLFLSRQILGPIKALTEGTQALISRRFQKRISIRSKDELGRLSEDFNTLARTLEQYEALRQQWLSDISHELRTPLSVLRGEIEALQDGIRKADPHSLSSLHTEVIRIGKLVEDLHLLSLADSQDLLFQKRKLDPIEVLRETVGLFQNRVKERGLHLDLDIEKKSTTKIEGNPDRLKQVFSNILENALRYGDAPGTLRISTRSTGEGLTIRFEDSGPGVPPESMDRLFDRLYRVEPSRSRESGGSGLGLAICKQIVEAHEGRIEAENSTLGGLAILITLPLC